MQIDMHYYGTYAMARAAGLERETAQVIATSAQFVDDNIARDAVTFRDGSRIDTEATAHHPIDLSNRDDRDQRRVWVPFHFLPGNVGETYTERLKCRMDSPVVQEMCEHHLIHAERSFGPHLLGIATHVYADTFSHYGFSGVSSRGNRVENDSFRFHEDVDGMDGPVADLSSGIRDYITQKATAFFTGRGQHGGVLTNIKTWVAEEASGALGHGSVATLPDRPYLVWSFDYERQDAVAGTRSLRNNPATFLAGCRALHGVFRKFADRRPDLASGTGRDFDAIEPCVREILLTQAEKAGRIAAWRDAAKAGRLFGGAVGETIPDYGGEDWNAQWANLDGGEEYGAAMETHIWRFYQAAAVHRTYVLRELLPKHGLVVD